MSLINLRFVDVSFSYESTSFPVINNLTLAFGEGWTGIIGTNGSGKTTLAKLAAGILIPDKGSIIRTNNSVLYCSQSTEFYPEFCDDFFESSDNESGRLCSILRIKSEWKNRWGTLSLGERKRVQTAVALWKSPGVLIMDEPTNHLDNNSTEIITEALFSFEGIGLLISHNRIMLDRLCRNSLFVGMERIVMRPGGVSEGLIQEKIEEKERIRVYENKREKYEKLKTSAISLKKISLDKKKTLSKSLLDKKDHDGKGRVDAARLLGKDKNGSRKAFLLGSRADRAKEELQNAYYKKRDIEGFNFSGERAGCDFLLKIDKGIIRAGQEFNLSIPGIIVKPDDRIGITGNNGTGKTTFLRYIKSLFLIPDNKIINIPQEIEEESVRLIKKEFLLLDEKTLGLLLSIIHRLGSEPERILETGIASPGETRKIMLAMGLLKDPNIIIMDEPTNHLDLPSVLALEKTLFAFNGALIIVSHDKELIKKLTRINWEISAEDKGSRLLIK